MIYIICYDWPSTSGNHTGMRYLYEYIQKRNPELYKMYTFNMGRRFLDKGKKGKKISVLFTALKLAMTYKSGDKFVLTEYLHRDSYQILFAKIIRFICPKAPIYAMVHLVPEKLERRYSKAQIKKSSRFVTEIVTLGSSLTCYLNNLGIENIYTSYQYLVNNYYTPSANLYNRGGDVKVIVMGALARDFEQIAYIVSRLPQIHFYICKGRENIDYLFSGLKNATLVGYVPEAELKHYMNDSDISLNVMKDTIGSNVICTSMATGLAMVVSDVGSIRDYCDETNACFCSSPDDFIKNIMILANDRELLNSLKKMSLKKAQQFSIDNYCVSLSSLLK